MHQREGPPATADTHAPEGETSCNSRLCFGISFAGEALQPALFDPLLLGLGLGVGLWVGLGSGLGLGSLFDPLLGGLASRKRSDVPNIR